MLFEHKAVAVDFRQVPRNDNHSKEYEHSWAG